MTKRTATKRTAVKTIDPQTALARIEAERDKLRAQLEAVRAECNRLRILRDDLTPYGLGRRDLVLAIEEILSGEGGADPDVCPSCYGVYCSGCLDGDADGGGS